MVIFEPCALTVPSGSCPGRRREWAIAERAYPATSSGWQVTQRLAPVGALSICGAGVLASRAAAGSPADWLCVEITLARKTSMRRSDRERKCAARGAEIAVGCGRAVRGRDFGFALNGVETCLGLRRERS